MERERLLSNFFDDGFALLEVMVAFAIFMTGVAALFMLQVVSAGNQRTASGVTLAMTTAQSMLEQVAAVDYSHPAIRDVNQANNHMLDSVHHVDHMNTDAFGNPISLQCLAVIRNIADDAPVKNTKTIKIIVTAGGGRRLALSSVKSKAE